jgi:hypothetical protein
MFRAAGANLPGPVTYFTDVLANWRADPTAKNNFSYKFTDADCIKGGKAPVKKSKVPVLQAVIDDAGGELQREGAGGSMSVIGAMPVKKSKVPVLQAVIDDAGGELQRAGAGGSMSVIGAMNIGAKYKKRKQKEQLGSCSTCKVVPRARMSDMCNQCQTAVMLAFLQ